MLWVSLSLGWVYVAPQWYHGKPVKLKCLLELSPCVVCAVAGAAGCGSCVSGTRGSFAVTRLLTRRRVLSDMLLHDRLVELATVPMAAKVQLQ